MVGDGQVTFDMSGTEVRIVPRELRELPVLRNSMILQDDEVVRIIKPMPSPLVGSRCPGKADQGDKYPARADLASYHGGEISTLAQSSRHP